MYASAITCSTKFTVFYGAYNTKCMNFMYVEEISKLSIKTIMH